MSKKVRPEVAVTEGAIWQNMLRFFIPLLIGSLFQQLYNTVDAIVVGNYASTQELAAVGSASAVFINLLTGFFLGIGGGAGVIIAQYYGARDDESLSHAVHTAIAFALAAGAVLTVLGITLAEPALRLLGTPADVIPFAKQYMTLFFTATVPNMLFNIGSGILRAIGDSRRPQLFLVIACVTNIILDVLFGVGFRWGVFGVGLATAISITLSGILVCMVLVRSDSVYGVTPSRIGFHGPTMKKILSIGLPAGFQSSMYGISNMIVQSGVNTFGTAVLAGWTAFNKLDSVYWMVICTFNTTVMTFAGQNFGAGKYRRMRTSVRTGMIMSYICGVCIVLAFLFLGRPLMSIFTTDGTTVEYGVTFLMSFLPGYLCYNPIEVLSGGCRSTGDSVRPMLISAFGICGFRIIWTAFVMPVWHTQQAVAGAYVFSWMLTSAIYIVYYLRGNWLKRHLPAEVSYTETLLPRMKRKKA